MGVHDTIRRKSTLYFLGCCCWRFYIERMDGNGKKKIDKTCWREISVPDLSRNRRKRKKTHQDTLRTNTEGTGRKRVPFEGKAQQGLWHQGREKNLWRMGGAVFEDEGIKKCFRRAACKLRLCTYEILTALSVSFRKAIPHWFSKNHWQLGKGEPEHREAFLKGAFDWNETGGERGLPHGNFKQGGRI